MKEMAEEQIMNQIEANLIVTEKMIEKLKIDKELVRIQKMIDDQREEFETKKDEREERMIKEQQRLDDLKRIKDENLKVHAQKTKEVSLKFQDDKKQKFEQDRRAKLESDQRVREEVKVKVEANKPKVQTRQEVETKKIIGKVEQKEMKVKTKIENEQRIEKALENYSFRPKVEMDFNRVVQETEALTLKKKTVLDKADQVVLFRVDGFNVKDLMKDMRYKISSALYDAGLSKTDYATSVIGNMVKKAEAPMKY